MGLSLSSLPDIPFLTRLAKGKVREKEIGRLPSLTAEQLGKVYRDFDVAKSHGLVSYSLAYCDFKAALSNEVFTTLTDLRLLYQAFGTNEFIHDLGCKHDIPPEALKVDFLEVFSLLVLVSRAMSKLSKTRLLFSVFDLDKDGRLSRVEFALLLKTVLRGILKVGSRGCSARQLPTATGRCRNTLAMAERTSAIEREFSPHTFSPHLPHYLSLLYIPRHYLGRISDVAYLPSHTVFCKSLERCP